MRRPACSPSPTRSLSWSSVWKGRTPRPESEIRTAYSSTTSVSSLPSTKTSIRPRISTPRRRMRDSMSPGRSSPARSMSRLARGRRRAIPCRLRWSRCSRESSRATCAPPTCSAQPMPEARRPRSRRRGRRWRRSAAWYRASSSSSARSRSRAAATRACCATPPKSSSARPISGGSCSRSSPAWRSASSFRA